MTARARKIAVLFYNALRHGMDYVDPGTSYYETRYRERVIGNLHRCAKAFGFILQPDMVSPIFFQQTRSIADPENQTTDVRSG